jgi:hypothetical protein
MKTSELTGAALDWAVAMCEGATDEWHTDKPFFWDGVPCIRSGGHDVNYRPSTNWSQGGPIIEREIAKIERFSDSLWEATAFTKNAQDFVQSGPTPLIASMRCYVASKLGDEVEVPEDLVSPQTK